MYNNGMSIQELLLKFKRLSLRTDIVLILIIVVSTVLSFMLGRMSMQGSISKSHNTTMQSAVVTTEVDALLPEINSQTQIEKTQTDVQKQTTIPSGNIQGAYVASKSGTKYHLPWCGSAKQIKEENKIWFATKEDAEKAGYTPSANCKGI